MRAGLRFGIAALAAALALAPVPAGAQSTAEPAANTASLPADTVGPRELQDFSLNGTVTRPAPATPARPTPARPAPAPRSTATPPRTTAPPTPSPTPERPAIARAPSAPPPTVTLGPPADTPSEMAEAGPAYEPEPGFGPVATTPVEPLEDQPTNFLPWLIALLLGAGAGLYFWRRRSRPGYAVASGLSDQLALSDELALSGELGSPEPAPAPQPLQRAPPPRPAQPGSPPGVVTTRLRPWLDIAFSPGRCVVEDDKATIQFDVVVHNSGSAPARDVLIEASMFNAGPAQDEEIGAFFAHPVAKGDRIPAIPPLKRVALKSAVSLSREQLRQFEVAGRRLFVPLIGFNALYRWSGGEGQTSASYLVGRDTQSEKMAPLRLDLGPRIFRGLGAREHNIRVRK